LYQNKARPGGGMTEKDNSNSMPSEKKSDVTILLIEDEDIVRTLARKLLESHGFSILEASTIQGALEHWDKHANEIGVLLADVQLPDGSTKNLVAQFQREKPTLKVIFTSGYSEDVLFDVKNELRTSAFIQKPFHPRELLKLIDTALKETK
jgi:two-component system cell cycle sensor histidine kinase/response regulator CckA